MVEAHDLGLCRREKLGHILVVRGHTELTERGVARQEIHVREVRSVPGFQGGNDVGEVWKRAGARLVREKVASERRVLFVVGDRRIEERGRGGGASVRIQDALIRHDRIEAVALGEREHGRVVGRGVRVVLTRVAEGGKVIVRHLVDARLREIGGRRTAPHRDAKASGRELTDARGGVTASTVASRDDAGATILVRANSALCVAVAGAAADEREAREKAEPGERSHSRHSQ